MNENRPPPTSNLPSLLAGIALILLGILFLAGQFFNLDLAGYLWPFYVLVPGALILIYGLSMSESTGDGVVVFGSMITVTGMLLLYQNTTGHWESWAYAWSLVAPTSIGLGQVVFGKFKGRDDIVRVGKRIAGVGLVIFLAGFVFFELIIGISGFGLNRWLWPLLLIGLGLALLAGTIWPRLRKGT
jgi:hypothetical protein